MTRNRTDKSGGTATPMMKQYLSIKREHPDAILFFRMGDFYEMFMEDAVKAAEVLKIALTSRDKGKENSVPMCGVPYHAAESYLTKLVRSGFKVAICEQVEDPRKAKGLVRREVTRIVTPGTAVEEALLEADEPSYLASIVRDRHTVGIALLDVTTGDFRVAQWKDDDAGRDLDMALARFSPREILVPEGDQNGFPGVHTTRIEGFRFHTDLAERTLMDFFGVRTLEGYGLDDMPLAVGAAGSVLWYVNEVHGRTLKNIKAIRPLVGEDGLVLDRTSLKNLEITHSQAEGRREGSLLNVMDRTVTPQGARLLKEYLIHPLRDAGAINARLDLVEELVRGIIPRGRIRETLREVSDVDRILSRLCAGTVSPRDLAALRGTLAVIPALREILADLDSDLAEGVLDRLEEIPAVRDLLEKSLVEAPPAVMKEGGVILDGYSEELDELRSLARDGKRYIADLEKGERERTKIPSLKIGFNRVFGYYIEVTNAHRDLVPDGYIRKQTLVNAERYVNQELKEMEERILTAEERMTALEKEIFERIKSDVMLHIADLQRTARGVAEIDVFTSLSELAHTSGYGRPIILEDDPMRRLSITNGRHPVVEKVDLGETFVPNSAYLDGEDNRLLVITGPNMAGKSTFMRQVALIVIMAQMGSFVPAEEAIISPVDRIFTRVGAADVLTKGLSTFMVEMVETADILHNATPQSLVLLDEIGRGTSTFDGISIAWAVAEYLLSRDRIGCKTLFATHYHELTELSLTNEGVKNYNVAIREWGERLVFLRRVQEGPADGSYGIQVARLAGLPEEVISRSRTILRNLEDSALDASGRPVLAVADGGEEAEPGRQQEQMGLFAAGDRGSEFLKEIAGVDLDGMTPLDALNLLAELKKRYG
ncbi:MAG: DNA mismatch repair protein MutS [bacterium]|nr:MAG: DNA mismatch repair protein MutS [bacterium]